MFEEIKKGEFDFPSPYWDDISEPAKELIQKLLMVKPSERMTIEEILVHPWIVGDDTPRNELPQVQKEIQKYNALRKMRRATAAIIAANRFKKLVLSK